MQIDPRHAWQIKFEEAKSDHLLLLPAPLSWRRQDLLKHNGDRQASSLLSHHSAGFNS